ncbi:MAG: alpha-amylase [Candidatus Lokiarchaeota archaeon]|nr:alpha-amylase [Candidatus Lokiarchaeota archaeon]
MEQINYLPDWAKRSVIYHIYPLGFFDAPRYGREESKVVDRLSGIRDYYDHFQNLGINTIQFGPIFESVSHGYDTIDYMKVDHRLGTNDIFKQIVSELHNMGIKVLVDGVFNHVSREFDSFKDIQEYKEKSWRKHWHRVDFSKNSPYDDGFDYENWEGHYELVKLNLDEKDVRDYIFSVVRYWLGEIDIDGWRLDVAYQIKPDFWRNFRRVCKETKQDCFLIGEMIHGPYDKWVGPDLLDAGTSYQIYKSIWSAFNSNNMYELKAVIERSFHPEWGVFKNIVLVNFLGNHDTTRIRSILKDERYLYPAFIFLFTSNGIPKIYYGDEIGMKGVKGKHDDYDLRKPMPKKFDDWPVNANAILEHLKKLIQIRKNNHALIYGSITPVYAQDNILVYLRRSSSQTILIVINNSTETQYKKIPLWNQNLNGSKFVEILEQGGNKEYTIHDNHLEAELFPCWGRILLKIS